MPTFELQLLAAAVLLVFCVFASKATGRLGVPTLVVFLFVGMLAGSEGIGRIDFDNALLAQSLGIIALTYILFSGGLDTKWTAVRPILKDGISLSTLGVLLTCVLIGLFVHFALGMPVLDSFLLGAIVSSTDAGAVFTVLRSKDVHLKKPLRPLLELESGSNDPMAVFLTTSILSMMGTQNLSVFQMVPLLFKQMLIGGLLGVFLGKVLVWLFNGLRLHIEGLYIVLSIAVVLFIYSFTQELGGNGFLAVYLAGLVLGNHNFVFKKSLSLMHDGVSWLMQSAMFLTLGLLIYPSQVLNVAGLGVLISSFMILLARPISVFIALSFSQRSFKEKLLISWVGLRGSVPVIMATYPLVAGINNAYLIFNLVFFVALTSLILQGTSIPFISQKLGLYDSQAKPKTNYPAIAGHLNEIVTIDVPRHSFAINKTIVDLEIPLNKLLIIAIERKGEVIIPRGTTTIESGDKISLLADDDALADFFELIWKKKIDLANGHKNTPPPEDAPPPDPNILIH